MDLVFPDFSQANVLVIGDVMLDRYYYGDTKGISQEAPVAVVHVNMVEDRPGGAANVAMNIASLGSSSKLISIIGSDDVGKILKEKLCELNVSYSFVNDTYPTTVKVRVLSNNQQLIRLDFEKRFKDVDVISLMEHVELSLPFVNVLVLSDYGKGVLSNCVQKIIIMARELSVPIIVDPKGTDFSKYSGATLLTPNLSEFKLASSYYQEDEDALINRATEIMLQYNLSAILITRSEDGMTLLQVGEKPMNFPAESQKVCDVTGAGDTVVGVLAASLSSGKSLEESCFIANVAAGLVVKKLGTSVVNGCELKNVFNGEVEDVVFGILDEKNLIKNINLIRKRGERIVMTNGVFDILHAGHVAYLTKAKKLGDRLIVAVNSDFSTKRLKGVNRPVNSLEKRMFVLSALNMVDWVVSFDEDTPQRLIANLLPDYLVKGGDYQWRKIDGSQEVLDNGGQVYVLDFESGCSTTKMINALKKY